MNNKKALVFGEVMLDRYIKGKVNRISPESPVPIINANMEFYRLGAAANVCLNLANLGLDVSVFSIIGKDDSGNKLKKMLIENNINTNSIQLDLDYPTIVKTRYLAENNQQLLRVDNEKKYKDHYEDFSPKLEKLIKEKDLVLISDYGKGLMSESLTQEIIRICNSYNIPILIDVKGNNLNKYNNAFLLKPNFKELLELLNIENDNDLYSLEELMLELKNKSNIKNVIVTLGSEGMALLDRDNNFIKIDTIAKEVFDVTGAGDTVLAYLGYAISKNMTIEESMNLANKAAGIQVGKVGTSVVSLDEISLSESKIISIEDLHFLKKLNKKIVFTNGVFDILHLGHLTYLEEAKNLGDILVVGVNSDSSVKKLKGPSRPINNIQDRMRYLSKLSFIDYVIEFNEDTPYELIKELVPDVLVKGGDYDKKDIVGSDVVLENGGIVTTIEFLEGFSSTNIINKM